MYHILPAQDRAQADAEEAYMCSAAGDRPFLQEGPVPSSKPKWVIRGFRSGPTGQSFPGR